MNYTFHKIDLKLHTVTQKAHARGAKTPRTLLSRCENRAGAPHMHKCVRRCVNSAILYEESSKNETAANPFFVFNTNTKRRQVLTECV